MTSIISEDKHDTEIISAATTTEEPAVKMMANFIFIVLFLACFLLMGGGAERDVGPGPGEAWVPM